MSHATTAPAFGTPVSAIAPTSGHAVWLRTTPGRIILGFIVVAVLALVTFLVSWEAIGINRHAVQVIGYDTKPSIVAAQRIRTTLGDVDATIANDLLTGGAPGAGTGADARTDQSALGVALADAAHNITYDPEWAPVRAINQALPLYYEMVGDIRAADPTNSWLATSRALGASRYLRSALIPAADALDKANRDPLDAAFVSFESTALPVALAMVAAGAALIAALAYWQFWLSRHTHRLVNLPMALATLVCAAAMSWVVYATLQGRADVYTAKQDAFESIHTLNKAKSTAYAMNADESLWLLERDPQARAAYEASFLAGAKSLVDIDPTSPAARGMAAALGKALDLEMAGKAKAASDATPKISGLLGDEMDNVTFGVAERRPASEAILNFLRYTEIDRQIRALENKGDHQGAVELCTGVKEGQSNWAFNRFDKAVDEALAVNDAVFTQRMEKAVNTLKLMPWVVAASLALTVLLASIGLWTRLEEYR